MNYQINLKKYWRIKCWFVWAFLNTDLDKENNVQIFMQTTESFVFLSSESFVFSVSQLSEEFLPYCRETTVSFIALYYSGSNRRKPSLGEWKILFYPLNQTLL